MRSEKVPDLRGHATRLCGEMGGKTKKLGNEISGILVSQPPLLAYPEILGTPASKISRKRADDLFRYCK